MKLTMIVGLSLLAFQATAQQKHICTHANVTRTIEVVYSAPENKVPCSVVYTKPEGVSTLWQANNQVGYCEAKAQSLSDKLITLGWRCQ